jgi:hypothetical protein
VADNTRDVTVTRTVWGWSAFVTGDPDALIGSANEIDQLVPLLRELDVKAFTVELES